MKRKTKEGRSMRACKILAKELAIRRPRIKLSAGPPARTPNDQLPYPTKPGCHDSIMALPPLCHPSPPLEIADIPCHRPAPPQNSFTAQHQVTLRHCHRPTPTPPTNRMIYGPPSG
ncbi:hypothetical protein JTB14_024117 [Gonioctena quinquepunctata]|nr:hypothetical protein JTB14_024117 [Gonioctena quinquepunctata]